MTVRAQNTRRRLLLGARQVFARDGFYDARITDITAEAGVAIGSFYTYFESKEEIFREVVMLVLEDLATAPGRDPDNVEREPVRDIAYATRQYFLAFQRNVGIARSIQQMSAHDEAIRRKRHSLIERGAARGERYIRTLQHRGLADPTVDPKITAEALQSMIINIAYDKFALADEPVDLDELVTALTRIWIRAVGIEEAAGWDDTHQAGRERS